MSSTTSKSVRSSSLYHLHWSLHAFAGKIRWKSEVSSLFGETRKIGPLIFQLCIYYLGRACLFSKLWWNMKFWKDTIAYWRLWSFLLCEFHCLARQVWFMISHSAYKYVACTIFGSCFHIEFRFSVSATWNRPRLIAFGLACFSFCNWCAHQRCGFQGSREEIYLNAFWCSCHFPQ